MVGAVAYLLGVWYGAYGQFEEQKKRDIEWAYAKMSTKEKVTLKRRMAEINKAGAGNKESMPPNLTFV
jgi:hypothetical protein